MVPTVSSAVHGHGRYTVEDWESLPESNWPRVELINGEFAITPPPTGQHQYASDELRYILRDALRAADRDDLFVVSGIGIKISFNQAFVPDLAILDIPPIGASFDVHHLVLAVEIVSPGSTKRDRLTKPASYAAAGVPFYWRVEAAGAGAPEIVVHRLQGGAYVEEATLKPGTRTTLSTATPVPVTLDPADLPPLRR
ncbi:Uma2 family endonuclease [Solihabitans fulvus]|uniref:Uma2 family endonuclease n=1 Tax=Solihabitans fulvus TaxID=1892852 RepID=A0A5B2X668_9PSEU|nr:Uma2 family endonuclease [Solihabitans fulvus]KAA2258631.1 Uma2 family endonuclease [Solihabitans fulvus]